MNTPLPPADPLPTPRPPLWSTPQLHLTVLAVSLLAAIAPWPWVALVGSGMLVLWLPGHSLLRILRLRTSDGVFWQALAGSIVLIPLPLGLVWRFSQQRGVVLATLAGINVLLGALAWVADRSAGAPSTRGAHDPGAVRPARRTRLGRSAAWATAALAGWVGLCVASTFVLPVAGGHVAVNAAHDWTKHHAVLLSLVRERLPLRSPFYAARPDIPYYYYEQHYYLAAALHQASGGVPLAWCFGLTSAATACALVGLTGLLARHITRVAQGPDGAEAAGLLASACVSLAGGWDALAVAAQMAAGQPARIVLDSWIPTPWRLHNLATQYVWCPQHVAGLLTLVLACVWLSQKVRGWAWVALGPLLAASAWSSSVYLASVGLAATGCYLGWVTYAARRSRSGPVRAPLQDEHLARTPGPQRWLVRSVLLAVAAGAIALMGIRAWEYAQMSARFAGGLTIRWPRFPLAVFGGIAPPGPLANYLDAPWILLIELGPAALGLLGTRGSLWHRMGQDPGLRLLMLASAIGTAALYTVRSTIHPNDYSFRIAIMPLQVLGACCAAALLRAAWVRPAWLRWRRPLLAAGVLAGLPVGLYELPLMAIRSRLPGQALPEAGAVRWIRAHTPPDAVMQRDPRLAPDLPQLTDRRVAAADLDNAHVRVFFPPRPDQMRALAAAVDQALSTDPPGLAWQRLHAMRVTHLLIGPGERQRYGPMPQLEDTMYFECAYRDPLACVYRLRMPAERGTATRATGAAEGP